MADFSTSQLSEITSLSNTDLINVSQHLGGSSYESKKINAENAGKYFGINHQSSVYVAKNGDNTTGSGSFHNPYLTVEKALSVITDADEANRYSIFVSPGVYEENNPLTMKSYVNIYGTGGLISTRIDAANSGNIFNGAADSGLFNFILRGSDSYAIDFSAAGLFVVRDISISNCTNGIHINNQSALVDINGASAFNDITPMTDFLDFDAGKAAVNNIIFVDGSTITNGIHASGSNTLLSLNQFITDTINLTNGILIDNGADVTVNGARITGDSESRITNAIKVTGNNSHADILSVYAQHSDCGILVDNGGLVHASATIIDTCDIGLCLDSAGNSTIELNGGSIRESLTLDVDVRSSSNKLLVSGTTLDEDKLNLNGGSVSMCHVSDNEGDEGVGVKGELHVGSPENPSESVFGEGDSYTRGMIVLTTDSTATSTTDGGNLTDVSTEAQSPSGSTFTFQGTAANHTILVGSTLINTNTSDVVKYWGLKISQIISAVEVTPKSFTFEYWDGTNWTEHQVMTTHSSLFYRYANESFIRSNISEHTRFGLTESDIGSDWAKKTINSNNLYWTRIRINTTITTAPTFQQFKISNNRFEANSTGFNTFHGLSRFRRTITTTGNVFGESGGVTDANVSIGSGGIPTGWTHNIKNSKLNGVGDALYFQIDIPKGVDTSQPLILNLKYQPTTSGASTDGVIIVSLLPIEAEGVLVADPTGGTTPIERTLANTEIVTANVAQTVTESIPIVDETRIQNVEFKYYNISDYYEGDFLAIRIELDDDGSANKDIIIWGLEISGVQWRHGDNI